MMQDHSSPAGYQLPGSKPIRIALLHFAPGSNDIHKNLAVLENAIHKAALRTADLILTPELAVSGYEFFSILGIDWIREKGRAIIQKFCEVAQENRVSLVVGCPSYDKENERYHNSAFVITEDGSVAGRHDKILTLPGVNEGWSSPGSENRPVPWHGRNLGLMICADAYRTSLAEELVQQGAQVLFGLSAWAPGFHAPNGEWEKCSLATGLSFFACNRTGKDVQIDFTGSSSAVVIHGQRILEYTKSQPAILFVTVDPLTWQPLQPTFDIETIP